MPLRTIINAVQSIAAATGKIGKLYPHIVWTNDEASILTFFKDANGRIDAGMITRGSTQSRDEGPNNNYDYHEIVIEWYRGSKRAPDDSTNAEDSFQDDVETFRAAFNANRKLAVGGVRQANFSGPMEAKAVNYVTFCGVLCNHATLAILVKDGPNATMSQ